MNIKSEWDLKQLYKNDTDPQLEKDVQTATKAIEAFAATWKPRVHELTQPSILKKALDEYEHLVRLYGGSGKAGFYIWLRTQQDQLDSEVRAKSNKMEAIERKNSTTLSFFRIYLSKLPQKDQAAVLASPLLKDYHHFLEQLFVEGAHTLSEAEERILTLTGQNRYGDWVKLTSTTLSKEEREITTTKGIEKKTFDELASETGNTNQKTRDQAAAALNEIFLSKRDIAEAELNAILENKKTLDELRGYTRPDTSRHENDDVESEVVDTLLNAVEKRFTLAHEFYKLKAQLLGKEKLAYHERNVPIHAHEKEYTFEQSVSLVERVFKRLDPECAHLFTSAIENGQVDALPKKGKRGGAFCVWWSPDLPVYVLLNHANKLTEVCTIAHEFGHAINAELAKKSQNALNFSTPTSTTEVASTFMEDFVLEELMREADKETKLSLMMSKLNDDVSTIIRQVACYRLEQALHQAYRTKGYLSADEIGAIFQQHMKSYMGPYVEQSPGAENWWIYWSHIRNYFYVYSYASGLLISKALQEKVAQDPHFMKKVKAFFAAGGSKSPRAIFAELGIDITKEAFWNEGLDKVETLLKKAEALARQLKKI